MSFLPGDDAVPVIGTKRYLLRPLADRDLAQLLATFGDRQVTRFTSRPVLRDEVDARRLLREIDELFARRELFEWGIARRRDDEIVGTCTLADLTWEHRRATVGFALGRAHWGQGIITEVLPALLALAFERLALHRLDADADPRNDASIRALQRAGFSREGYARQAYCIDGEWQDAVLFGMLRTDPRPGVSP